MTFCPLERPSPQAKWPAPECTGHCESAARSKHLALDLQITKFPPSLLHGRQLAFQPSNPPRSQLNGPWHVVSRHIPVPRGEAHTEQLRRLACRIDALGWPGERPPSSFVPLSQVTSI